MPYGDELAFVEMAAALAADPTRLACLRAEAAARITVPSWAQVAAQVERIWLDCLDAHRRRSAMAAWGAPWPVLPAEKGSSQ